MYSPVLQLLKHNISSASWLLRGGIARLALAPTAISEQEADKIGGQWENLGKFWTAIP